MSSDPLSDDDWWTPPAHPIPKRPDSIEAWHYTNRAGLEGMLGSNTLWATSRSALNDTAEVEHGLNHVRDAWDLLSPSLKPEAPAAQAIDWLDAAIERTRQRDLFFFSATKNGDSLAHWNGYGGEFAMQFDPAYEFRLKCVDSACEVYTPDFIPPTLWRHVTYSSIDELWLEWHPQEDPAKRIIIATLDAFEALNSERIKDETLFFNALEHNFLTAICLHKSQAFEYEDEVRLLAVAPPDQRFIKSRVGAYGEMTYVELAPGDDLYRHCVEATERLPIMHIRVAPGPDAEHRHASLRELLDQTGYGDVSSDVSPITFRLAPRSQ